MDKLLSFAKGFFRDRKRVVIAIGVVVVVSFLVWQQTKSGEEGAQIQTAQVERGTVVSTTNASGQVLVSNINNITTQASGTLKTVYVADGDMVQKGQKIAEVALDSEGLQNQAQAYSAYLSAKNSLESTKATQYGLQADMLGKWDDFKELAESESYDSPEERALPEYHISEKEWLAAEAKYKNQQAVITQTQAAVNSAWLSYQQTNSVITAPVSGRITSVAIAPGMQLGSSDSTTGNKLSQRVAAVVSEGTPIASFNVSEIDVSLVEAGQKATVVLDSIADKTFTGKVVSVDRIGSLSSGVTSYPVIISFDTGSKQILPNMAATAKIIIDKKNDVLLVPVGAVQIRGGQSIVRVLRNGKEQAVAVEVGISSDTQTEIISGLEGGDEVIISAAVSSESSQGGVSPFGGFGPGGFGGAGRLTR